MLAANDIPFQFDAAGVGYKNKTESKLEWIQSKNILFSLLHWKTFNAFDIFFDCHLKQFFQDKMEQ